jgi:hypothetical protein
VVLLLRPKTYFKVDQFSGGGSPEPVGWQSFPPRLTLPIAILSVLVAVYGAYNQHRAAIDMRASADRLAQQLRSTQIALDKANMENAALEHVSLPGLFRQYDAHIAMLRTAADADIDVYETVKMTKERRRLDQTPRLHFYKPKVTCTWPLTISLTL